MRWLGDFVSNSFRVTFLREDCVDGEPHGFAEFIVHVSGCVAVLRVLELRQFSRDCRAKCRQDFVLDRAVVLV